MKYLFITLLFFSVNGHTKGKTCSGAKLQNQALIFANGMFNSRTSARNSLQALKGKTNHSFKAYDYAYNTNETALLQALEVAEQKFDSVAIFTWSYFSEFNGPQWFSEVLKTLSQGVVKKSYIFDKDLQRHVKKYKKYLDQNLELAIVAHSQGNFYANRAYEYLMSDADKIRIVSVANPDSQVAGEYSYRTLKSDGVINSIPGALPPNVDNNYRGHLNHSFVESYLNGSPSGQEIIKMISQVSYFPKGYLDQSLHKMDRWVNRLTQEVKSRKLSKIECLATDLFLHAANWSNNACKERNINTLREYVLHCFDIDWSNPEHDNICRLHGLYIDVDDSEFHALSVFAGHSECQWDDKLLHENLTKEILHEALDFIQNPKERSLYK